MSAINAILRNHLSFDLVQISLRDLSSLKFLPCDLYGLDNGIFKVLLKKSSPVNRNILKELILRGYSLFFVTYDNHESLKKHQQKNLVNITRSLSIGDSAENGNKLLNALSINLNYLYEDPSNDEYLRTQVQSIKNLASMINSNPKLLPQLYKNYISQKHHYL